MPLSHERAGRYPVYVFCNNNLPSNSGGFRITIQLAAKKFGGGWKVLHPLCPKCMEERDDEQSVKSCRSTKSSRSLGSSVNGNANGQHNKNGCWCVLWHFFLLGLRPLGSHLVFLRHSQRSAPSYSGRQKGRLRPRLENHPHLPRVRQGKQHRSRR